jgi:hypothetical protein
MREMGSSTIVAARRLRLVVPTQVETFATKNACIQAAKDSECAAETGETNFALAGQFFYVKQE